MNNKPISCTDCNASHFCDNWSLSDGCEFKTKLENFSANVFQENNWEDTIELNADVESDKNYFYNHLRSDCSDF